MRSRRTLAWAALAVVVAVGVVVLFVRSRPGNSAAARTARLERELACPACEGQSVADSESVQARAIRDDIPRRIAAGQSDRQILDYYVSRYTARILETPTSSGIGLVAWLVPLVALILGASAIFVAVRRWTRTPRLHASDEDEEIVRRFRAPGTPGAGGGLDAGGLA